MILFGYIVCAVLLFGAVIYLVVLRSQDHYNPDPHNETHDWWKEFR